MTSKRVSFLWALMASLIGVFALMPTMAQDAPRITVAPAWRPASTLDSVDNAPFGTKEGVDDFRYVEVEIYATTTVPFWSAQVTCTVAPAVLTTYNQMNASDDGDTDNSDAPVKLGPNWGTYGTDYTHVIENYNVATGARTVTATRLGNRGPMGSNGYADTFLLLTLRYRVKDLLAAGSSPFTCTSTFLNRNGKVVIAPTYTAPAPLSVITGYTVSGVVQYQGRASHAGIAVNCDYDGDNGNNGAGPNDFVMVTSATGAWTRTTRAQGYYYCEYYGDLKVGVANTTAYDPERFLAGYTQLVLNSLSYTVPPVTLRGGNLSLAGDAATKDEFIDMSDISALTQPSVWNVTTTVGDINGDGRTNQADLTILSSNIGYGEVDDSSHVLYSTPLAYQYFHQSRVWLGRRDAGEVAPVLLNITPDSRDMWATMSPDGKTMAFVRDTVVNNVRTTALFTAPIVNGVAGVPVRVTPVGAWYHAFAPSWSPDGTRLAFVCSWYDDGGDDDGIAGGFLANMGDLCVIDVTGRNFRSVAPQAKAKIYPPAWWSNIEIVYGGSAPVSGTYVMNNICPDTLCFVNISTGDLFELDVSVTDGASGTAIVDMPTFIPNSVLVYRFYDSGTGDHILRWARMNWGMLGGPISNIGTMTMNQMHLVVTENFNPISTDIAWYTTKQMNESILFTESTGYEYRKSSLASGNGYDDPLVWSAAFDNSVYDQASDPFNPDHTPYIYTDQDLGSWDYAYRSTADWVP